ncbi:MAG: hypothetical protein AUG88_01195 [Actinobacteria bacterium 13_1_20CM_4_68_12]|nr:MAG: hypothetical protein AUG88_01195 [Actinobacteria bacterium 13_1_20CM_4_68_12]
MRTQKLTPEEQIRSAREAYENGTDFTLAVEEEFAVLDPETLSLANRFEELQAAAQGTPLEEHLVGELIASEVEVRTGRCESFAEAAAKVGERRAQLDELAGGLGIALAAVGTHPWSPWQEQRIIDTPHYRKNDELLRYVVWRNNTFGLHVHVGIRGADRAIAVCNGLRNYLPELLAVSASSPMVEAVCTYLHSARTEIFTRMFPRCGVPDAYDGWRGFEDYVRCYALTARIARALDEGEPLPNYPHRLIEENFWRAIRYGLSGELIDLTTGDVRPARAHLERLLEWVAPVAEELGAAQYLAVPTANSAERQLAQYEDGASLQEIYAGLVRRGAPVRG